MAVAGTAEKGVEGIVEALPDQGQSHDQEDDGQPGEHAGPPVAGLGISDPPGHVVAPLGGHRRVHADAEEREAGHGDRLDDVGEDVPAYNSARPCPEGLTGLHIWFFAHREHRVADHPEVLRDVDDGDGDGSCDHSPADRALEQKSDHYGEQKVGEGEDGVVDQHQEAVQPAPEIPRPPAGPPRSRSVPRRRPWKGRLRSRRWSRTNVPPRGRLVGGNGRHGRRTG